ncbi:MAG: hypothetical protein LBN20_05965, partial [Endomicrobium sp.]|nr:hypothetical protein [Endomicrobium sp.]
MNELMRLVFTPSRFLQWQHLFTRQTDLHSRHSEAAIDRQTALHSRHSEATNIQTDLQSRHSEATADRQTD